MTSIVGKKRGKATYYYLVESARVDGKPRIVSQEYLGTAEELAAAMRGGGLGLPDRTRHKEFGAVAATWGMLDDLGVAGIIDQVTGPRPAGQPLSTGTYLALAALNRLVAPCSKAAFADWWKTTAGGRFTKIPATALDHRRFWDAMHAVTLEQLERVSEKIAVQIVRSAGVDVSSVALDMTNFATFIDTGNEQVSADLKIQLIFSTPGVPRGHGRIERFFATVAQMFLCDLLGYAPPKHATRGKATLTINQLESLLRSFFVDVYNRRAHSETKVAPAERWEAVFPECPNPSKSLIFCF